MRRQNATAASDYRSEHASLRAINLRADRRTLPAMVADGLSPLSLVAVSGGGYHAELLTAYLDLLAQLPHRHRAVVLPLWVRGRLRPWIDHPRFGHHDALVRLRALDPRTPAWRVRGSLDRRGDFAGYYRTPYSTLLGDGTVGAFDLAGPTLAFARNTMKTGDVIATTSADGTAPVRAITPSAADMLPDTAWGDFEQFSFKGWNDETVHGYVVKPWNYEPGKKYPVAFLIHGGPQGSFGNGWSYRWNPQTYAGQGYAVVMVDFHGSTGYGQAFTDAISQHWGDGPLEDLQKGWAAALKQYDFLDGDKACALGASYGGFMAYWIAGNWNSPWKCIVAHDGVFDNRMMGYATEELWFSEHENGGTPWQNPAGYEKFNPINHVKDWKVPMLVVHSQQDFRIPVEQGIAAFTALQRKGIESKYLYFPDENHWVLKPQNSLLWHDTVNAWLKAHIGE